MFENTGQRLSKKTNCFHIRPDNYTHKSTTYTTNKKSEQLSRTKMFLKNLQMQDKRNRQLRNYHRHYFDNVFDAKGEGARVSLLTLRGQAGLRTPLSRPINLYQPPGGAGGAAMAQPTASPQRLPPGFGLHALEYPQRGPYSSAEGLSSPCILDRANYTENRLVLLLW